MQAFDDLLQVADTLHGPSGCPWDHKQTFFSLQPYVLEEAHELVEAVDGQEDAEIVEELGDLLYTIIFYVKIAEKNKKFSMKDVLQTITAKLIRRHPHVFAGLAVQGEEDIVKNWLKIKQEETGKKQRKNALEGIPDQLPVLTRMQKMVKVFAREKVVSLEDLPVMEEQALVDQLYALIQTAERSHIDIEGALRRKYRECKEQYFSHLL